MRCGILAAILLNSGAADYVITGCGTGEGAMLALNSFPGVICGPCEGGGGRRVLRQYANKAPVTLYLYFSELFFPNCKDAAIAEYVRGLL